VDDLTELGEELRKRSRPATGRLRQLTPRRRREPAETPEPRQLTAAAAWLWQHRARVILREVLSRMRLGDVAGHGRHGLLE
jgi:hypothetical protein